MVAPGELRIRFFGYIVPVKCIDRSSRGRRFVDSSSGGIGFERNYSRRSVLSTLNPRRTCAAGRSVATPHDAPKGDRAAICFFLSSRKLWRI
jgi:hypothetical protein